MNTDKERTPIDGAAERPMMVEDHDGAQKMVPKYLTALEKEYMTLLVRRTDGFATAEEFNAIVARHSSPDSTL